MRLHSIAAKKSTDFATSIVADFVLSGGIPALAGDSSFKSVQNGPNRAESPRLKPIDGFSDE